MKAIELGYHLLLEKPAAPTARECADIANAAKAKGVKVLVGHVLRYTPFFGYIKNMIDGQRAGLAHYAYHSGAVGIVCEGNAKYVEFRENDNCQRKFKIDSRYVWFKTEWGLDGVATFAFSVDGENFIQSGRHHLSWGYYRGDRLGLYCFNDKTESGFVDVDYLRYRMEK